MYVIFRLQLYVNVIFQFGIFNTFAKNSKNLFLLCHYGVLCLDWWGGKTIQYILELGCNVTKCGNGQEVWILSKCTVCGTKTLFSPYGLSGLNTLTSNPSSTRGEMRRSTIWLTQQWTKPMNSTRNTVLEWNDSKNAHLAEIINSTLVQTTLRLIQLVCA